MKYKEVFANNNFSDAELLKLHLRIRPLSSKKVLGGRYYLTQNFDTALSSLADNKSKETKQRGLKTSFKLLVQMQCDYGKFFVPTADEVINLIPTPYLKEATRVVGYSIKKARPFTSIHDHSKVPIKVNLYTLKPGAEVPREIQRLPVTRLSRQFTEKDIEND